MTQIFFRHIIENALHDIREIFSQDLGVLISLCDLQIIKKKPNKAGENILTSTDSHRKAVH